MPVPVGDPPTAAPVSGLENRLAGTAEPTLGHLVRLAPVPGVSVEWLATGRGGPEGGGEVVAPGPLGGAPGEVWPLGRVATPRYPVQVGAGVRRLPHPSQMVDWRALREQRRHRHGTWPGRIGLLEVHGDGVEPTIRSGDLVLPDVAQPVFREGSRVVWCDGFLSKRLRRVDHPVELLSDNPLYPPTRISRERWPELRLVDPLRWYGRPL